METRRTPDERFVDLPDFRFAPHYVDIPDGDGANLRMHYLDESESRRPVVLLMHGEPSWRLSVSAHDPRASLMPVFAPGARDSPTPRSAGPAISFRKTAAPRRPGVVADFVKST